MNVARVVLCGDGSVAREPSSRRCLLRRLKQLTSPCMLTRTSWWQRDNRAARSFMEFGFGKRWPSVHSLSTTEGFERRSPARSRRLETGSRAVAVLVGDGPRRDRKAVAAAARIAETGGRSIVVLLARPRVDLNRAREAGLDADRLLIDCEIAVRSASIGLLDEFERIGTPPVVMSEQSSFSSVVQLAARCGCSLLVTSRWQASPMLLRGRVEARLHGVRIIFQGRSRKR
jgi:hypothetical protein